MVSDATNAQRRCIHMLSDATRAKHDVHSDDAQGNLCERSVHKSDDFRRKNAKQKNGASLFQVVG